MISFEISVYAIYFNYMWCSIQLFYVTLCNIYVCALLCCVMLIISIVTICSRFIPYCSSDVWSGVSPKTNESKCVIASLFIPSFTIYSFVFVCLGLLSNSTLIVFVQVTMRSWGL